MKKLIRTLFGVVALALATAMPSQSFAATTNAVYLTMDGSGSIIDPDWDLQVDGYVSALNTVLGGGSYYGDVAIGVSIFGADVNEIFAMTLINDAGDLAALTTAIDDTSTTGGNVRGGVGIFNTAIGDAINDAAAAIQASYSTATNKVIDVSTDGANNIGANPTTAANAALLDDITTNCLGVGGSADCGFATGFTVTAGSFDDFEAAITDKLERELNPVPVPAAVWLFGSGLLGLVGIARRKKIA